VSEYQRVSLDDLLAEYDERPLRAQRRSRFPWWGRIALLALVFGGVIEALLRMVGFAVPYVVAASGVAAVALMHRSLRELTPPPLPPALHSPAWGIDEDPQIVDRGGSGATVDGLHHAVQRWESRLSWTERDPVRFTNAVRPRLAELTYELARQRHGVTADDPAALRELLGERLWEFFHAPIEQSPTPTKLGVVVARMEQI
jgi:hypothetical protein